MGDFQGLLHFQRMLAFAQKSVIESYVSCAPGYENEMRSLLEKAFKLLADTQGENQSFDEAIENLVHEVFRKQDPDFWFNRVYLDYKRRIKPRNRFKKLFPLIEGRKLLDLGCGDGLTSLEFHRQGYQVRLCDVLDYREQDSRFLPFRQMDSPRSIPFQDELFDTTILIAVLHHVEATDIIPLLSETRRISRRLIVEEDCYQIPYDFEGLEVIGRRDGLLGDFMTLPEPEQLGYLKFIDYFSNVITQGISQMNIPFNFKTLREWQDLFHNQGFQVKRSLLMGFQEGYFNRSCHVWFVLE